VKHWIFVLVHLLSLTPITHAAYQPSETTINMLFVGDVMLDDRPGAFIKKGHNPFQSFDKQFQQADIKIGNLECVVGTTGTPEVLKPFTFRANPRVIPLLKKYFTAVSLANNHSGDYGSDAFENMLDLLDHNKMPYFGGGRNIRDAHQPIVYNIKGKKVAILSYDLFMPRSFEALTDRPGVAWGNDSDIVFDIVNAKRHADIVIIYPHWGIEHDKMASPKQIKLAHLMIDSGADVIVGAHPHVTQNIEIYQGKPIFYSLGNFVFSGFHDEESQTGWALALSLNQQSTFNWTIYVAKIDKNGIPKNAGILSGLH
jgi:poly-gamma-glutamate synthesis protein (capsule biosynthesis protein)